jgi:hypothetical protein
MANLMKEAVFVIFFIVALIITDAIIVAVLLA